MKCENVLYFEKNKTTNTTTSSFQGAVRCAYALGSETRGDSPNCGKRKQGKSKIPMKVNLKAF